MTTARVVVTMLDGQVHEVVGVYMPLGDRIDYERRFGKSIFEKANAKLEPDGSGSVTIDTSKLTEESRVFFVWHMLSRAPEVNVGEYDDFWPQLESLQGPTFLEEAADPTVEDQQPTSSQS